MVRSDDLRKQAGAALVGATANMLQLRARTPTPPTSQFASRYRTVALDSVGPLFDGGLAGGSIAEDRSSRLERLSSVSLLSTVRGLPKRKLKNLLDKEEGERLDRALHELDRTKINPHCRYCSVLHELLYGSSPMEARVGVAPIDGDHHEGGIEIHFDPLTNVSEASIKRLEFFVDGEDAARAVIQRAHPLRWDENPLWKEAVPVVRRGRDWVSLGKDPGSWAGESERRFFFESVDWPWNEQLSAKVENVLRIEGLTPVSGHIQDRVAFEYSLEECCNSNFGISWESGGMDVDSGHYDGWFMRAAEIDPSRPLPADRTCPNASLALTGARLHKERGWKDPQLVTISASKRLRYTMPKNGPAEMLAILNWTSPVLLFNFFNVSILEAVHRDPAVGLTAGAGLPRQASPSASPSPSSRGSLEPTADPTAAPTPTTHRGASS